MSLVLHEQGNAVWLFCAMNGSMATVVSIKVGREYFPADWRQKRRQGIADLRLDGAVEWLFRVANGSSRGFETAQ
jgi:hypothetical protein